MHITALPPHSEADFLKALTQGANGTRGLPAVLVILTHFGFESLPNIPLVFFLPERILDERKQRS